MAETFGQALKNLRRSKGINQRDLAEQVGVDFSYISKVENDRLPPPSADTIVKICEILEIPPNNLLALTGKMPSPIKDMLSSSPAALEFMRQAHTIGLTENDWEKLSQQLKTLQDE